MTSSLSDLQAMLYRLVTAPGGVEEAAGQDPALRKSALDAVIVGDQRLSAGERLSIYANAYFYRLHDILKDDFPGTFAVLGDVNFHNLITGYLIEYPPNEPSVLHAGRYLPQYLQTTNKAPAISMSISKWPFLADLARLERACTEVFHGPDAEPLQESLLRNLTPQSWPSLRIQLHPAARILDVGWPIHEVMTAIRQGLQWNRVTQASATILVWRHNWQVCYRTVQPGERAALKAAVCGIDFASICETLASDAQAGPGVADLAVIINQMLSGWLRDGVLISASA